jgi:hypothetical protein
MERVNHEIERSWKDAASVCAGSSRETRTAMNPFASQAESSLRVEGHALALRSAPVTES